MLPHFIILFVAGLIQWHNGRMAARAANLKKCQHLNGRKLQPAGHHSTPCRTHQPAGWTCLTEWYPVESMFPHSADGATQTMPSRKREVKQFKDIDDETREPIIPITVGPKAISDESTFYNGGHFLQEVDDDTHIAQENFAKATQPKDPEDDVAQETYPSGRGLQGQSRKSPIIVDIHVLSKAGPWNESGRAPQFWLVNAWPLRGTFFHKYKHFDRRGTISQNVSSQCSVGPLSEGARVHYFFLEKGVIFCRISAKSVCHPTGFLDIGRQSADSNNFPNMGVIPGTLPFSKIGRADHFFHKILPISYEVVINPVGHGVGNHSADGSIFRRLGPTPGTQPFDEIGRVGH